VCGAAAEEIAALREELDRREPLHPQKPGGDQCDAFVTAAEADFGDAAEIAALRKELARREPLHPQKPGGEQCDAFVAAAAALRAENYGIPLGEIERDARDDAALAPVLCGFACLEIYKVHCVAVKVIDQFRSGAVDLAVPEFALGPPAPCRRVHFALGRTEFAPLWDTEQVRGDLTVKEFMDVIMARWRVRVFSMVVAGHQVYAAYWRDAARKRRLLGTRISVVVGEVSGEPIGEDVRLLRIEAACYDDNMGRSSCRRLC
jgi:hypothetical protein